VAAVAQLLGSNRITVHHWSRVGEGYLRRLARDTELIRYLKEIAHG
jgi:predicted site-specific integrase-resolvase